MLPAHTRFGRKIAQHGGLLGIVSTHDHILRERAEDGFT
jgi:hypothetical protein